ncbi:MAG: hypothetical protein U1E56_09365 [Bauldia sp.]
MRKSRLLIRPLFVIASVGAQAAELPLQGVYGTREVCDAIRAGGTVDKIWDNPTLEGMMFAPSGYRDSDTACTWDKVTGSPGPIDPNGTRWSVTATCKDTVRVHIENYRLLERRTDGILTILKGDQEPFSVRYCMGNAPP